MTKPFDSLPRPQQAGILCNDELFQQFAALQCGLAEGRLSVGASAEYLRRCCGIESRAELADNLIAQDLFDSLRTDFDAWRGKIAQPR